TFQTFLGDPISLSDSGLSLPMFQIGDRWMQIADENPLFCWWSATLAGSRIWFSSAIWKILLQHHYEFMRRTRNPSPIGIQSRQTYQGGTHASSREYAAGNLPRHFDDSSGRVQLDKGCRAR